jgi:hypothetical protein
VAEARSIDADLAELAAAQHGVVALWQIRAAGLSARAAQDRVAAGRLHRLFPGVYAVGHRSVSGDGRRLGAVLACGEGAVLSRFSAASAWGMLNGDGRRFDVVAPGRSGGRIADGRRIALRRTRRLPEEDVGTLRGIPITTVGRTLLDLAGSAAPTTVQRAVHEAEVQRLLDVDAVLATIDRNPGRRGTRALTAALGVSAPDPDNSRFVATFLAVCVDHGLPRPRFSAHVDGGDRLYEADALFVAERVIVELDSRRVHATARSFQSDRRRDSVLAARDYLTLRCTWHRLRDEPEAVAAELRSVLALRARLRDGHLGGRRPTLASAARDPDRVEEHVDVDGLVDQPRRARGQRRALQGRAGIGGVEQDRRRVGLGPDRRAELDAVLVAEAVVEHDDVRLPAAERRPHGLAALGAADAPETGLGAQYGLEARAQHGVIVDDEDADHGD